MTASSKNVRNDILEAFYIDNYAKLVKKVSGRSETPENCEDIVQDAFERALRYWDSFDPTIKDLDTWFGVILSNALKHHMAVENRLGMVVEFDEELYDGIEMSQVSQDLVERIINDINTTKGLTRDILDLYFLKSYKPAAIVEVLDTKATTVNAYVRDFRKQIQEKYKL